MQYILYPVMSHIDSLGKGQFQHLVSYFNRPVNYMHFEPAGIIRNGFKFQEFKLNTKRSVFHFKSSGDLLIGNKIMNGAAEQVFVAFWISSFKNITTLPFV